MQDKSYPMRVDCVEIQEKLIEDFIYAISQAGLVFCVYFVYAQYR